MVALAEFRGELDRWLGEALSAEGRRAIFVAFATEEIEDFRNAWRAAVGEPRIETYVDGQKGAAFESVRIPGGVIAARVNAIKPIVDRALNLFDQFTKVVTGGYKSQTFVFVNDVKTTDVENADLGDLVTIANISDFARKAERRAFNVKEGAPLTDGLFEGVTAILRREFRESLNSIYFTFRDYGTGRVPIIAIGEGASKQGQRPFG